MLKLTLIALGEKMPAWVDEAVLDYSKRVHGRCVIQQKYLPLIKRGKNADIARIRDEEGWKLLAAIAESAHIVALDVSGQSWSSTALSQRIEAWMSSTAEVVFLVGGPDGLSEEVLKRADERWSLSALTFAHPVVRVVWAEQIYRAWSILEGLPYHR